MSNEWLCFKVGHLIMQAAGKTNLKRVSLELGGKSPLIVCEDADGLYYLYTYYFDIENSCIVVNYNWIITVKKAADVAYHALFDNHGQSCCAGSRTFVHQKVYDQFIAEAKKLVENRKVGDPFDKSTDQGPQIDQEMFDKVTGFIESGKKEGATLVTGGGRVGSAGYFIKVLLFF